MAKCGQLTVGLPCEKFQFYPDRHQSRNVHPACRAETWNWGHAFRNNNKFSRSAPHDGRGDQQTPLGSYPGDSWVSWQSLGCPWLHSTHRIKNMLVITRDSLVVFFGPSEPQVQCYIYVYLGMTKPKTFWHIPFLCYSMYNLYNWWRCELICLEISNKTHNKLTEMSVKPSMHTPTVSTSSVMHGFLYFTYLPLFTCIVHNVNTSIYRITILQKSLAVH